MLRVLHIANPRVSRGLVYKLAVSVKTCISASCAAVEPGLAWIPRITAIRAYDAAGYSTTAYAASGDNSSSVASSSSRNYFVRREGSAQWATVSVSYLSDIADLADAIRLELPSLKDTDAADIALHRADVDDDEIVKALEASAFPSLKKIEELGLPDGACIVVKVCPKFSSATATALTRPTATKDEVRAEVDKKWLDAADRAALARKALVDKCPLLTNTGSVVAKDSDTLGVKVLCKDERTDIIRLGVFELPSLPDIICVGPKGFLLAEPQAFFLQHQRQQLAQEFVAAMTAAKVYHEGFGVLLSGPNGVGKSAVGLETFLTCFARSLPVVYIPSAVRWVEAASKGRGDEYFFQTFLEQNADLVLADPVLRAALAPVLRGEPVNDHTMTAFIDSLRPRPGPAVGVVVDEVQHIAKTADRPNDEATSYFRFWHNWDNSKTVFVRMDIASSHGAREMKLPSGEEHRLRVIFPWEHDIVEAATAHECSPLYFSNDKAREQVVFAAGGIVRSILYGKGLFNQYMLAGVEEGLSNNLIDTARYKANHGAMRVRVVFQA